MLAGMNVSKGFAKDNFLRSKFSSIVYPYFLWSLIQGGIQIFMSSEVNSAVNWLDLFEIMWKPIGQFWFLHALFLCHIMIVILTTNRRIVLLASIVCYVCGMYFSLGVISNAFSFFLFYAAGLLSAPYLEKWVTDLSNFKGIVFIAAGFLFSLYVAFSFDSPSSPVALPAAFLGMFLVLQISLVIIKLQKLKVIELLGLASMPIYLMHIIFGSGVRVFILKFGVTRIELNLLFGCLFVIVAPLVIYYFTYYCKVERIFGFNNASIIFKKFPAILVKK
ncbi:MAG: acyltransferase family protein [Glaciimonas sp.]|nr:acyltransferase family protein [Glaciimonas sp.]